MPRATVEENLGEARILWFLGSQNWAAEVTFFRVGLGEFSVEVGFKEHTSGLA
jgi:hypothetical protein